MIITLLKKYMKNQIVIQKEVIIKQKKIKKAKN